MKFNRAQFDLEVTPELLECIQRWSFCVLLNTVMDKEDDWVGGDPPSSLGGCGLKSRLGRRLSLFFLSLFSGEYWNITLSYATSASFRIACSSLFSNPSFDVK
jgi:hypothetical protein